ncbi:UPF0394 inner membrane protein YeeE-like [Patiria miniata]|uniref:Sulphur transport domain-containing protein n=1 Tax=Patiria miniata TaxID=46514 RepID=A0A914BDZ9_PATMI|nr:UPF0394 inner membrane protein YeeE-like [Patiria miniata]
MAIPFTNGLHCRKFIATDENDNSIFKMGSETAYAASPPVCAWDETSPTAAAHAESAPIPPGSRGGIAAAASTLGRGAGALLGTSLLRISVCITAGAIFGLAMEKGRVFEPLLIRNQMDFSSNVMLKMFMAAVSAVLVSMSALSVLPTTSQRFQLARDNFICRLSAKGVAASVIGGTLLGIGMTIGGACPGAVLVQIGAGVSNAGYTLLGCILGATLYGLTEQTVSGWTRPKNPAQKVRIDEIVGLPFWKVALPFGIALAMFVYFLEVVVPWTSDLTVPNQSEASLFALRSWLPSISGALIGCMQIPIVLAMGQTMGGSGSYCTMAAQLIPTGTLRNVSPYLLRTKYGLNNWWSIAYGCAAIAGAVFSASMAGALGDTEGVSALHAFLGGIIMVYGSRLAGGCTSGHGMSGMGTLCLFSFAAVPAMFVGGIGTLATMKLTGLVN